MSTDELATAREYLRRMEVNFDTALERKKDADAALSKARKEKDEAAICLKRMEARIKSEREAQRRLDLSNHGQTGRRGSFFSFGNHSMSGTATVSTADQKHGTVITEASSCQLSESIPINVENEANNNNGSNSNLNNGGSKKKLRRSKARTARFMKATFPLPPHMLKKCELSYNIQEAQKEIENNKITHVILRERDNPVNFRDEVQEVHFRGYQQEIDIPSQPIPFFRCTYDETRNTNVYRYIGHWQAERQSSLSKPSQTVPLGSRFRRRKMHKPGTEHSVSVDFQFSSFSDVLGKVMDGKILIYGQK